MTRCWTGDDAFHKYVYLLSSVSDTKICEKGFPLHTKITFSSIDWLLNGRWRFSRVHLFAQFRCRYWDLWKGITFSSIDRLLNRILHFSQYGITSPYIPKSCSALLIACCSSEYYTFHKCGITSPHQNHAQLYWSPAERNITLFTQVWDNLSLPKSCIALLIACWTEYYTFDKYIHLLSSAQDIIIWRHGLLLQTSAQPWRFECMYWQSLNEAIVGSS